MIPHEQIERNAFKGAWGASDLRAVLGAMVDVPTSGTVYAALATMAMGNTNAVEYGQASRIALAAASGAIRDEELIRLHGAVPRTGYRAGIMIDDHVGVEVEPAVGLDPRDASMGPIRGGASRCGGR